LTPPKALRHRARMGSGKRAIDRKLLIRLGIVAVGLGVVALLSLQGFDWRFIVNESLRLVREAGPLAFFSGMAVLPAFGFPLSPFLLGAGPAFAPKMGLPGVIAAAWLAVAINILLTYIMARWLLRPVVAKVLDRLGYRMPQVSQDNQWDITILLRVTPGPPFFVQSYLLGLGRVPLKVYLLVSIGIAWLSATAMVIFGEALLEGKGRMVLLGMSLLAALAVGGHLARKYYARKRVVVPA
jgi:uncharacterized membrane protein YdjX (TVP38/TMEM64 family)